MTTRTYVCDATRACDHGIGYAVCTRDEHADPFHVDDIHAETWCERCGCEANDHHSLATLVESDPDEYTGRDGFASCGSCNTCPEVRG